MNLLNVSKMQAGYTMGLKPDGRELLVVVVKGTFNIPQKGKNAELAEKQVPLIQADKFSGDPAFSSVVYESDYAPVKHRCDVLFNGCAYAPNGRFVTELQVDLQIKSVNKSFRVTGNRLWHSNALQVRGSQAQAFQKMPISYDNAFGGIDRINPKPEKQKTYLRNPAGKGYYDSSNYPLVEGMPLPNTEELNNPVRKPDGSYVPMSYGVIGRSWPSRISYAGTYDQNWLDNDFPFLPKDFNELYYQSAPLDQQTDFLKGGEEVILRNLTQEGLTSFRIPEMELPVVFLYKDFTEIETRPVIDTIYIEPEEKRFILLWRICIALKKNMFEIDKIVIGKLPAGWYKARRLGKIYYNSISELINEDNE